MSARMCANRYSGEWEKTVHRLGRWIDFEDDYKTLDPTFMESVWWAFSELHKKGLVYRGFKARALGVCSRRANMLLHTLSHMLKHV